MDFLLFYHHSWFFSSQIQMMLFPVILIRRPRGVAYSASLISLRSLCSRLTAIKDFEPINDGNVFIQSINHESKDEAVRGSFTSSVNLKRKGILFHLFWGFNFLKIVTLSEQGGTRLGWGSFGIPVYTQWKESIPQGMALKIHKVLVIWILKFIDEPFGLQ